MSEPLRRAGLEVLDTTEGVLSTADAWKRVISANAQPTVTVDDEREDHLSRVDTEWRRLAVEHGVLDKDGTFLISLPGPGAMNSPWTIVRLTDTTSLAEHRAQHPGEPEFVTAARNGTAVLGVTTEEHGTWLIIA
jgi:hypothetical protein